MQKHLILIFLSLATLWATHSRAAECEIAPIGVNESISGALTETDCRISDFLQSGDGSLVDVYGLTLTANGTVTITMESSEFDTYLRLLDSELATITEDDDSGAGFSATISTELDSGSYTILANSATSSTEVGNYTLTLTGPEGSPSAESRLINISTRAFVDRGDGVTIGGLIIEGDAPKTVVIRALGPELANRNVEGVLTDPQLQLFKGADLIDSNDDWEQHSRNGEIPAHLVPNFALEPVIVTTLEPGAYTAIVRGNHETTGVGLVEIFEADDSTSKLVNISTRGAVGTVDNVMIGGLIISGDQPKTVLIRALGPSLTRFGVPDALQDPILQVFSGPNLIDSNDNWQSHASAANVPTDLQPVETNESAIRITLQPGAYTAIVSGAGGSTGIGLVEVFELQ